MVFIGAPLCRRLFPRGLAPPGQKSRHVIAEAYHAAAVVAFLVMILARRLRRRGGMGGRSPGPRGEMGVVRPGAGPGAAPPPPFGHDRPIWLRAGRVAACRGGGRRLPRRTVRPDGCPRSRPAGAGFRSNFLWGGGR